MLIPVAGREHCTCHRREETGADEANEYKYRGDVHLGLKFLARVALPSGNSSDLSAVIGPVQEGLPLTLAAGLITPFAVAFDLGHVAAHSVPAPDLPRILFWHSPAHIVAAIPLEPSSRIIGMNPTLVAPH